MSKDSSSYAPSIEPVDTKRGRRREPSVFYPTSGLGSPLRVIAVTVALFIAVQFAAIFLVEIGLSFIHSAGSFNQSAAAQFFYVLIAEGGIAWAALAIVRRRKLSLGAIGLGRLPRLADLWRALAGFAGFYALLIVSLGVLSYFFPEINTSQQQDVGFTNLHTVSDNILAFTALVILPPLGEETLMRGYLYSGLRSRWRILPAMLMTSLLFGLAHLQFGTSGPLLWLAGADTLILSLVLVYLREKTGALYAGMLVHMLNNLVAFIFYIH